MLVRIQDKADQRSSIRSPEPIGDVLTPDIDDRYHRRMSKPAEILQGTLDLLILRTLEHGPLHGVGIADRIEQVTRGVFLIGPGSLFPPLHRLSEKGWIEGEWSESESGRRVKTYALTALGREQLPKRSATGEGVLGADARIMASEGSRGLPSSHQCSRP